LRNSVGSIRGAQGLRIAAALAALLGLAGATALVGAYGWGEVGRAFQSAGVTGLAAVCAAHFGYWAVCGVAWRVVLPPAAPRPTLGLIWARWVRDAGADLLPISAVGGDLMGARSAVLRGLPGALALASTVVDVTLELAAQLAFVLVGLAILATWPARGEPVGGLARSTLIGLAIAAPLVAGFVMAQRVGLFLLVERGVRRLAARWRWPALAGASGLHDAIRALHRDPRRLAAGFALHLVGWIASAAEAWLALGFLGAAPGLLAVLVVESLAYALRSAAFVVPAAVGVQEGGYVLLAPLIGVGPEIMLALSLLKRARDLVLGLPALAIWQWIEGARWRRGASRSAT
jgi:putative membrane protein